MPIEVECVGDGNRCVGRNGVFGICSVVVDEAPVAGFFTMKGVSSRLHRNLSGGFSLDGATMDRLAEEWMRFRGAKPSRDAELRPLRRKLREMQEMLDAL